MALKINTNISAMIAHKNMIKNDNGLTSSLEKLSSGLRINKAADDSSGMAIADALRSQGLGLGQAIKNANDGISVVQTADGALEESINIVNTIKTKAIQAAQDGQTVSSRKAIQADINKLMEELDIIAKTTSFNNQKLLSGNFTNKAFQVGAYSGETVNISIDSTESTKVGHIATSKLTFADEGVAELNVYSNVLNQTFALNSIELAFDNTRENSIGAVADAINKLSDLLGITATTSVETTAAGNVTAGSTSSDFAINGVAIGAVGVEENDANGGLVSTINGKTDQHGVIASVDEAGILTLTSTDDRAIEVTADSDTLTILGATEDMSTLGEILVTQAGAGAVSITDANSQAGIAVSVTDSILETGSGISGDAFALTSGSYISSGSYLASGTVINGTFTVTTGANIAASGTSMLGNGSVVACGSTIGSGTTVQGSFMLTVGANGTSTADETLTVGTFLACGTNVDSGSVFIGDVSAYLSGTSAGSVVVSGDGNTYVTSGADVVPGGFTLTAGATLNCGSAIASGSIIAAGSELWDDYGTIGETTLTADMDLGSGSLISSGSVLATGSVFTNVIASGHGTVAGTMSFTEGSLLSSGSLIYNGSTLGSVTELADDEVVADGQKMLLAGGSGTILDSGSLITAGTVLTNQILDENGTYFEAGTTLEYDIITGSGVALENDMILNSGSILRAGTLLHSNTAAEADGTTSSISDTQSYTLSDINVTTQEGAQIAMAIADEALKALDKVRSDLGSVQNQLTSTIANVTATRVNIFSAESSIRDVDFAEESSNYSKMQILAQAGTFAMAQANASSQNVLSLLQ